MDVSDIRVKQLGLSIFILDVVSSKITTVRDLLRESPTLVRMPYNSGMLLPKVDEYKWFSIPSPGYDHKILFYNITNVPLSGARTN